MMTAIMIHRAKTTISDVIGAVEERRIIAKELLLQIQLELGNEKLLQIMEAVKLLHRSSVAELKERAVELLHDKPELLDRFLAFLPKRFRF
jgi:Paired amphipathic helix repeat